LPVVALLLIVQRVNIAVVVVAALAGAVGGWFIPSFQHRLYTEPEFRVSPASGRRLLALRLFCAVSLAVCLAFNFRPDRYEFGPALLAAVFLAVFVVLSSTDFDRRRIPNKLTYPAMLAALVFCWAWPDRSVADIALGAAAGLAAAVVMVGLGILVGGGGLGLGIGDAKLILLLGAILGWPRFMPALLYGVLFAGIVAVAFLASRGRKSTFSYGPYLAAGGAILLLFPDLG